jgi:hypothetical protein
MPQLKFQAADLIRVVDHAIKTKADLVLVHDQGVYLMSGGLPPDLIKPPEPGRYVAYARGCNPNIEGWWDRARDLVGGDDFGEPLPWAEPIKEQIERGAPYVSIGFSGKRISLNAFRGVKQVVK